MHRTVFGIIGTINYGRNIVRFNTCFRIGVGLKNMCLNSDGSTLVKYCREGGSHIEVMVVIYCRFSKILKITSKGADLFSVYQFLNDNKSLQYV